MGHELLLLFIFFFLVCVGSLKTVKLFIACKTDSKDRLCTGALQGSSVATPVKGVGTHVSAVQEMRIL